MEGRFGKRTVCVTKLHHGPDPSIITVAGYLGWSEVYNRSIHESGGYPSVQAQQGVPASVRRQVGPRRSALPLFVSSGVLAQPGKPGANDKIQLGLIGAGGMGRANLKSCTKSDDVVVTGICEVWKERRDETIAEHGGKPKPYNDYRELLQQKDVDAVIIASPPHWHALMAIDACEAGMDIYLQKPMTLHLGESLAVKAAVKKHNRISHCTF